MALLVLWSAPAHAGGLRFEITQVQMPETLPRGQHVRVPIVVRNLSEETWEPARRDHLAYHLRLVGSSKALVFDGLRTELPHAVAPGESVVLDAHLEVPDIDGELVVEWAMVRESVQWFPRPQSGVGPIFERRVDEPRATWRLEKLRVPKSTIEGVPLTVRATLVNEGWATWDETRGDRVALHWYDEAGSVLRFEGTRTSADRPVAPGEGAEFTWTTLAPEGVGARLVAVEPVREGVQWYGPPAGEWTRARVEVQANPFGWSIEGEFEAPPLAASDELTVSVSLANRGSVAWMELDHFSYQWLDTEGQVVGEGPRTFLPKRVEVGERVDLEARIIAPDKPGPYRLRWGMLREGVRWYGEPERGADQQVWALPIALPRLAFELVRSTAPGFGLTGELENFPVTLKNVGSDPWNPERGDALAYHWVDEQGEMAHFEGRRSELPDIVAPGTEITIQARLEFPRQAGNYHLQLEMVREQVRWYGGAVEVAKVRVWRQIAADQLLLALCFVVAMLLAKRARVRWPRSAPVVEWIWLIWAGLALGTLLTAFSELAHLEFWRGGSRVAWSGCGWLVLPVCLASGRWRRGICIVMLLFAATLTLADLVYMHFFGSIVPVSSLGHANHLGEVFGSARTRLATEQLWLFFPPLVGLVAWRLSPVVPMSEERPRLRWPHRLMPLLVCVAIGWPAATRLRAAMSGGLGSKVFSEQHNAQRFGIFNAHAFDLARVVRESMGRRKLDAEARARVEDFFTAAASFAAQRVGAEEPSSSYGAAKGSNLLLIQVEALQSWVIGTRVEGHEVTPFLNSLRGDALHVPHVVDQTAQGKTSDGEYLVLNSQHPLPRGATAFLRADNHFWTLAHALKEGGYSTSSAHPYRRGFWNRAVLHPRYGFDSSVFRRELGPGQYVGWGLADGLFFERMLPRLTAAAEPWFAFWVTLSLHHPYDEFPESLATLDVGDLAGKPLGNYLQAMNYFDRSLVVLLKGMDDAGLLEHTVVALYGDHDARFELDEHPELLELAGAGVWTPSTFAIMESVPLFVLLPEGRAREDELKGVVDVVGGQIDIGPTLLHLLGVPRPRSFVGQALVPGRASNFAAYPNGGAYGPDRVWIRRGRDIPRGGACFFWPSGKARAKEDCKDIATRAREELGLSRAVADTDLQRELAGVDRDRD